MANKSDTSSTRQPGGGGEGAEEDEWVRTKSLNKWNDSHNRWFVIYFSFSYKFLKEFLLISWKLTQNKEQPPRPSQEQIRYLWQQAWHGVGDNVKEERGYVVKLIADVQPLQEGWSSLNWLPCMTTTQGMRWAVSWCGRALGSGLAGMQLRLSFVAFLKQSFFQLQWKWYHALKYQRY